MGWRERISKLMRLIVAMSLFHLLFGCKQAAIKGPDFSEVTAKVVHFNTGSSAEYEMPGNMSKYFGYDQRYRNESERTMKVDLSNLDFRPDTWQSAHYLDGASWEYTAGKSQGVNGELGSLSLSLFVGRYSGDLSSFVAQAYDGYFNGPNGANTEVRKIAAEEGQSEDELAFLMVEPPESFSAREINSSRYLCWTLENEHPGRTYTYFLYALDNEHYLAFSFYRTFSANSEEELAEVKTRVDEDIENFMSRAFVRE